MKRYQTGQHYSNVIVSGILLLLAVASCKSSGTGNTSVSVTKRDISKELIFSARVYPGNITNVAAPVSGVLEKVNESPGNLVKAGAVICSILDGQNQLHPVKAPKEGTLMSFGFSPGEYVGAENRKNEPLFTIADISREYFSADLDEADAVKLHPGDPVFAFINGDFSIRGTVLYVNNMANQAQDAPRFRISGQLTDSSKLIRKFGNDLPVKVVLRSVKNVLSIEKSKLVLKENKYYLNLLVNGKATLKEVTTGVDDGMYIEITSGVKEGDQVAN